MQPTTEQICIWCGERIVPRNFSIAGTSVTVPGECTCPGAVQERLKEAAEQKRHMESERARRMAEIFSEAGIRRRFRALKPNQSKNDDFDQGKGLFFHGVTGSGKTTQACAFALGYITAHLTGEGEHLLSSRRVLIANVPELLSEWRSSYDTQGITEDDVLWRYTSPDLLILDDLGKGAPTDWALERVYQVVNIRYEEMKATIATSQYKPSELIRRLAQNGDKETASAIVSRLRETCELIPMGDKDRRLEHAR